MEKILAISVASYNVEKTISKTLDSLICKKEIMDKIEVYIVNDGSTDATEKIVSDYVNKYPDTFIYVNKENGGHGSTLNYTIHNAKSKYLKMLDGDDWVETNAFENLVEFLEDVEADVVLSPYKRVYDDGTSDEIIDRHGVTVGKCYSVDEILPDNLDILHAHEVTVKTECIRRYFCDITEKCVYTDDEFLSNVVRAAETYAKTSEPIYCYRLGFAGQTVGVEGRIKHIEDAKRVSLAMLLHNKQYSALNHSEKKKTYILRCIANVVGFQISNYLLLDDFNIIKEKIENFICDIKEIEPIFSEEYLNDSNAYVFYEKLMKMYADNCDTGYVIVGAGQYGKRACSLLGDIVRYVCFADNYANMEECKDVPVMSIANAVKNYPTCKFFVSSVKNRKQLEEQLVSLGVKKEKII